MYFVQKKVMLVMNIIICVCVCVPILMLNVPSLLAMG